MQEWEISTSNSTFLQSVFFGPDGIWGLLQLIESVDNIALWMDWEGEEGGTRSGERLRTNHMDEIINLFIIESRREG